MGPGHLAVDPSSGDRDLSIWRTWECGLPDLFDERPEVLDGEDFCASRAFGASSSGAFHSPVLELQEVRARQTLRSAHFKPPGTPRVLCPAPWVRCHSPCGAGVCFLFV